MRENHGEKHAGGCLCGGVTYEVDGPLREIVACHCIQCRKTSGHHVAATAARLDDFRILSDQTLRWYHASDRARRGFCGRCGGNLFWSAHASDMISIFAGTLDTPTELPFERHIYVKYKADYFSTPAGAKSFQESD